MRETHVCYNLEHVKRQVWKDHTKLGLIGADGKPASRDTILCWLKDAIDRGYEVFPLCNNVDAKGHCKGHERQTGWV